MSAALDLNLAHLSPRQRELFDLLHHAAGCWVEGRTIRQALWGGMCSTHTTSVLIYYLRGRLVSTGWAVELAPGRGAYRLVARPCAQIADRGWQHMSPALAPETCLLCGAHEPSHVAVREGKDLMAYRLCGKHTLREVILDGRFFVDVERVHDEEAPLS